MKLLPVVSVLLEVLILKMHSLEAYNILQKGLVLSYKLKGDAWTSETYELLFKGLFGW